MTRTNITSRFALAAAVAAVAALPAAAEARAPKSTTVKLNPIEGHAEHGTVKLRRLPENRFKIRVRLAVADNEQYRLAFSASPCTTSVVDSEGWDEVPLGVVDSEGWDEVPEHLLFRLKARETRGDAAVLVGGGTASRGVIKALRRGSLGLFGSDSGVGELQACSLR